MTGVPFRDSGDGKGRSAVSQFSIGSESIILVAIQTDSGEVCVNIHWSFGISIADGMSSHVLLPKHFDRLSN